MPDKNTELIRSLCTESAARLPLRDRSAALEHFRSQYGDGEPQFVLGSRLKHILIAPARTGFDTHDLRAIERTFTFESAIGPDGDECSKVLNRILTALPAGSELLPLADVVWPSAIDVGRLLTQLSSYEHQNPRMLAVAAAGKRLIGRGYSLSVDDGRFILTPDEMERVTTAIQAAFDRLGPEAILRELFRILHQTGRYVHRIYFPGRVYQQDSRDPSDPFGFLLNLAVRARVPNDLPADAAPLWSDAINLGRDLVAVLDVEPYSQFEAIDVAVKRIECTLREFARFDHLFTLRQWSPQHASSLLHGFFDSVDREHIRKLDWSIDDALALFETLNRLTVADPQTVTRENLLRAGVSAEALHLLPTFSHSPGSVNKGYVSPLAADKADLMFRPLIALNADRYLLPAASLLGPAFYECIMAALRNVDKASTEALVGRGTEAVATMLLGKAGLSPTIVGSEYQMGADAGECDVVVESDESLLFIECKGKPLTRAAMSGKPASALIDFGAAFLASQVQALRHERILRTQGHIAFTDGKRLEWRRRRIHRLSLMLLDQGALQNPMLLWNLFSPLLRASFTPDPDFDKRRAINQLNDTLNDLRSECEKLEKIGLKISTLPLRCSSLNIGQMAVLLDGARDLEQFLARMSKNVTTMSYDALLEFFRMQRLDLLDEEGQH